MPTRLVRLARWRFFFLLKALEPLGCIRPGFQSCQSIACGVSRGTPTRSVRAEGAPQAHAREPGSKKASEASPPPKFIGAILGHSQVPGPQSLEIPANEFSLCDSSLEQGLTLLTQPVKLLHPLSRRLYRQLLG